MLGIRMELEIRYAKQCQNRLNGVLLSNVLNNKAIK